MISTFEIRKVKDRVFFWIVCFLSFLTMIPLFLILWELLSKGYKQINLNLFTQVAPSSMDAMLARVSNESIPGGILNGLMGTAVMLVLAIVMSIPVGILAGIYLAENKDSKFSGLVRSLTDLLQGVPSIVIGVVVYAWVVRPMHNYSALAGSISLAIMMLPMIIRSTEESLKMVPGTLKEAGLALGASYSTIVMRIVVPAALGGLFTGSLIAICRVMGETAPLLLTALGASSVNFNVTEPTSAVPLLIWQFYNDPNLVNLIWTSALMLLVFVLVINIIAKNIAKKWKIQ